MTSPVQTSPVQAVGTGNRDRTRASKGSSPHGVAAHSAAPPPAPRWSVRNWPLRAKLVVLLVVPLTVVSVLAAQRIADRIGGAAELDAFTARVDVGRQASLTVDELQRERALAAGFVGDGRSGDPAALLQQFTATDAQIVRLREDVSVELGGGVGAAAAVAAARLNGLSALRNSVQGGSYPDADVVATYSAVIATVADLSSTGLAAAVPGDEGGALQRAAAAADAVTATKEQISRQHATLLPALVAQVAPTPRQLELLRASDSQFVAALNGFLSAAGPVGANLYSDSVTGAAVDDRERIRQTAVLVGATGQPIGVPADRWDAVAIENVELIGGVESTLVTALRAESAALAGAARTAAIRDGLVVALLIVLAVLLLLLVARSLARPLRRLQAAAFDVAEYQLPAAIERMRAVDGEEPSLLVVPIGVDTREEIGQVARAFDAVHAQAVRLAAQQALLRNNVNDIFVNLSRRSQALVGRQLRLIDDLEKTEQDPDDLDNLFQLDHLATRMRRNNENLLVLAGAAELRPRRKIPISAQDVLRASVSEVEEYRRIFVGRAPDVSVAGPVVNDLVHLVAELLDNATNFSPPESPVQLGATSGEGGRLVLDIQDVGVGIEAGELATINANLGSPPVIDVSVSRRMGLFVVARLAARHNISVALRPAPSGPGLLATVEVPAVYLQTSGAANETTSAMSESSATPRQVVSVVPHRPVSSTPPHVPAPRQQRHSIAIPSQPRWPARPPRPTVEPQPAVAAPPATPPQPDQSVPVPVDAAGPPVHRQADEAPPAPDPLSSQWDGWEPTELEEQYLPIYGEMRSAWFRQRRFAPVLGEWPRSGDNADAPRDSSMRGPASSPNRPAPEPWIEEQTSPQASQPGDVARRTGAPSANSAPDPAVGHRDSPDDVAYNISDAAPPRGVRRFDAEDVVAPAEVSEWGAADAGWLAARSAAQEPTDDTTTAGLPKRRPRARLVPGSVGEPDAVPQTRRSPETVRGRLTGYQQGLRQGREARAGEAEHDQQPRGGAD